MSKGLKGAALFSSLSMAVVYILLAAGAVSVFLPSTKSARVGSERWKRMMDEERARQEQQQAEAASRLLITDDLAASSKWGPVGEDLVRYAQRYFDMPETEKERYERAMLMPGSKSVNVVELPSLSLSEWLWKVQSDTLSSAEGASAPPTTQPTSPVTTWIIKK